MHTNPDVKWQTLIEMYLSSLHHWQRTVSKASPGPGLAPSTSKMSKVQKAYTEMKDAELSLKKYEADMGN